MLPMLDVLELIRAGVKFPADPCIAAQDEVYLVGLTPAASRLMAYGFSKFHQHDLPAAADVAAAVQSEIVACAPEIEAAYQERYGEAAPEGWMELIAILVPVLQKAWEWFQKRRQSNGGGDKNG